MNPCNESEQFYILPTLILEFTRLLMESGLSNSLGCEGDYLLVEVYYDGRDSDHLDYIRKFQAIDDAGY